MATKEKVEKVIEPKKIKPGSREMESMLAAGYPDIATREHAQEILAGRKANPALVPWELAQRAEAFLAALDATPIVIDTDPGITEQKSTY